MIKFEILESFRFRGGNHYCFTIADTPHDLFESIKDAWYGSGIARHEGELFLYAHLSDADGNDVSLFLGDCTLDKNDELHFNFPYLGDDDCDSWYSFGLFSANATDDFESVLNDIFDLNSPDRVLGAYLYKVALIFDELAPKARATFNENMLANILDFGHQQGKLLGLWQWIFSSDGLKYIDQLEHGIDMSTSEIVRLSESDNLVTLQKFVKQYKKDFGITLYLPSNL